MQVVGIIMQFIPGFQGWSLVWWKAMMWGFASGFLSSGGNLKAGLLGAMGGALFAGTGELANRLGMGAFGHALIKGIAGGALQAAGGGDFKEGFLGAFAGGYLGETFSGFGGTSRTGGSLDLVKRVVRDSVIGGIASKLGGGKFQNGAVTAAFARLFNDELPHGGGKPTDRAMDVDKAVERLDANATDASKGRCAAYVREAIEAGGTKIDHTTYAKDYGPSLEKAGFDKVDPDGYEAQKGDVAVIQPPTGQTAGHMQMYDGREWVSDFRQRTFYPGPAYRRDAPSYEIYRP